MTEKAARPDSRTEGDTMSAQERAAIKERAAELKAQGRAGSAAEKAAANEAAVLAKIAEMPEPDRSLAERVHATVTACAPDLEPKLYYGQPGYARKGKPPDITVIPGLETCNAARVLQVRRACISLWTIGPAWTIG